jgi:hypothetical protein
MTQPVHCFREGDRVQLIQLFGTVAAGTYGTILTPFIGSPFRVDGEDGVPACVLVNRVSGTALFTTLVDILGFGSDLV